MSARSPSDIRIPVPSLRARQREQTAAAILDAAEENFADKGLGNAHMNDIALGAGVAVGTLYNHFEDRDALLVALLETRRAELLARIDAFLERPSTGSFRDDLTGFVQEMGAFFEEHKRFHIILHRMEWGLHQGQFPATAACAPAMKRDLILRVEKLMRRGIKLKALRAGNSEYYAYLLMGILRSIRLYHVDNDIDGFMPLDEVVRFFMEGAAV